MYFAHPILRNLLSDENTRDLEEVSKFQEHQFLKNDLHFNTFQGFNYSVLENDADFNDFVRTLIKPQLKTTSRFGNLNNFPGSEEVESPNTAGAKQARKFFTVKQMIMYFQATPMFGKFAYYGCWCFPEGSLDLGAGYGEPVDEIDRTCKKQNQCHRCASMKFGKSECPASSEYKFRGIEDEVTKKRYVVCLDDEGTCGRSLCECDKQLAETIAGLEFEWETDYHAKWGNFDRPEVCRTPGIGDNRMRAFGGGKGGNQPDDCCGKEGELFPYYMDSGRRSCCGNRTYNTEVMKCCPANGLFKEPYVRAQAVQC